MAVTGISCKNNNIFIKDVINLFFILILIFC